ncbi:uncharacterized protein LOC131220370 [Magnolia sinica]|uniref:uncharacterized protein LOC131220370 n=1 Tax=Magnolia sinica TaxID=86752 RepID=UPI002658518E|nr:uncharacterized protein LOC131220370 [Magnolia sinica]
MKLIPKSPSYILLVFCFGCIHLLYLGERSTAQTTSNGTTDPSEVAGPNSVFRHRGMSTLPTWNISGEPYRGNAINDSKIFKYMGRSYTLVKCQCMFDNGTTGPMTTMRVYTISFKDTMPEVLGNLSSHQYDR